MNDKDLVNFEIDLEELKKNELNESFLMMFGTVIKWTMKAMFDMPFIDGSIKGRPGDIKAFAKAIGNEKKYVDIAKEHGLNDPKTYKQKSVLQRATKAFEKKTGIKWPFK
jgi:hypothetical protein